MAQSDDKLNKDWESATPVSNSDWDSAVPVDSDRDRQNKIYDFAERLDAGKGGTWEEAKALGIKPGDVIRVPDGPVVRVPDSLGESKAAAEDFLKFAGGMAGGELAVPLLGKIAGKIGEGAIARSAARPPGAVAGTAKEAAKSGVKAAASALVPGIGHYAAAAEGGLHTIPKAAKAGMMAADEALASLARALGKRGPSPVRPAASAEPVSNVSTSRFPALTHGGSGAVDEITGEPLSGPSLYSRAEQEQFANQHGLEFLLPPRDASPTSELATAVSRRR